MKQYALSRSLPVLQPEKMKALAFLEALKQLHADLQVVVAFRMMPEAVWNMPPMGTINVHGSLLPQYRGAAPINWAIINGETETGVTTFKLKHEIDTGDILLQQKVPITPADNAGTMHDKLMAAGAALLVTTVKGLADDSLHEIPQQDVKMTALKHAPKLFKEHMLIAWDKPVLDISNLIRGLSPYPAAFMHMGDKTVKIFAAHVLDEQRDVPPGKLDTDNATYFRIAGSDGWVYIDELQMEGKKE